MKKAVFLDRDGVLNRSILVNGVPKPPISISDIQILEGAIEAIEILKNHNFVPVVVTNQPDVARGITTQSNVEAINAFIGNALKIDHFYTCFHDDVDSCNCRKPKPGLILLASSDLCLDPHQSFMVGDRWRDISAGQSAGCKNFFIDYSYQEKSPFLPHTRVFSLLEAVHIMTGEQYGTK
jgi:D-glycero-D-manno-heptose 1,7-bisphosphate phosphatase